MTLSRDLSSSSFYIPLRVSADLCRMSLLSASTLVLPHLRPFLLLFVSLRTFQLCRFRDYERRIHRQNAIQYPVDPYRLSSMNSIGSAHIDVILVPDDLFASALPIECFSLSVVFSGSLNLSSNAVPIRFSAMQTLTRPYYSRVLAPSLRQSILSRSGRIRDRSGSRALLRARAQWAKAL
jgi:hypothetical protein